MFADTKPFSGFAVPDVPAAKAFYGDTLGLRTSDGPMGLLTLHLADETDVISTPSPITSPRLHDPELPRRRHRGGRRRADRARRDGPALRRDAQDERGIMREGGPLIAWFTDPAGNVLSVLQDG